MSDYLNNIVSRSLSVADVVQPRVPHLFEQTVSAMAVDVAQASPDENAGETIVVAGEVHGSSSSTPPSRVNPEVSTPFFEQFRSAPMAHTAAPPATPGSYETSIPLPQGTNRNAELEAVNDSATRAGLSSKPPVTQQRRTVNHNDARVADPILPNRVGPVTQSEPSAAIRRSEPASPNTRHASVSQAVPAARPQHNRVVEQLPAIKISIGRVDVRAIMPAGQPKAAVSTRPKPALSLESYLKQREEGKR